MKVHACAACIRPLHFSTQPDGTRDAVCCALRYTVLPDVPGSVLLVQPFDDHGHPGEPIGRLTFDSPEYGTERAEIRHRVGLPKRPPRGLI